VTTPASGEAAPSGHVESAHIFGVNLIGATRHNLHKLILTLAFIGIAWIFAWGLRHLPGLFIGRRSGTCFVKDGMTR